MTLYHHILLPRNVLILLALFCNQLHANDPIVADRPGFSTGTYTVQPGTFNIEMGYQVAFNEGISKQSTQTLPLLVLRTGITSKIELDLFWDGWNRDKAENQTTTTSNADLTLGGKYRLIQQSNYNLTLLGLVSVPSGSAPSTSNNIDPLLGLLWDSTLSNKTSLFGVVQTSSFKDQENREYDLQIAIGAAIQHSNKTSSFLEMYYIRPFDKQLKNEAVIDGGLTYLLNNDIQLDVNLGVALNNDSDHFIGFGVATRY